MTRITCVQMAPVLGDLAGNADRATAAIAAAVAAGADVVVLPELVTSGYVFESVEEVRAVAITSEHEVFARWSAAAGGGAAGGTVVVAGFAEAGTAAAGERGSLFNSAVVLDASGVLAVYRKAHLWDRERLFFTPGDAEPPVVQTAHGRIGAMVCYDLEFPEWVRAPVLAGADLVAVPTNWPFFPRPDGERPGEVVNAMAAARLNRVAIACADRAGVERGQEWVRGTCVVSADGWVLAASEEAGAAVSAEVDLAASRTKALTELADVLGDRRPELYGAVVAPRRTG